MDRPGSAPVTGTPTVDAFLAHHGVKGMKWGVRKDAGHEGESAKTTKIASLDKKFEKKATSGGTAFELYNSAAHEMNSHELGRINSKSQYKNADLTGDTPLSRQYEREVQAAFVKHLNAAAEAKGTNASGTRKYSVTSKPDGSWDVEVVDVKHSDDPAPMNVTVVKNKQGLITGITPTKTAMAQGEELVVDFLSHHGIKGMKWGHRKGESSGSGEASADHLAVEAHKAKLKAGGTKALSNNELQAINTRMQLEQTHRNLVGQKPSKFETGHISVKKILSVAKTVNDIHNTVNGPAGKALKTALKGAAKTAA